MSDKKENVKVKSEVKLETEKPSTKIVETPKEENTSLNPSTPQFCWEFHKFKIDYINAYLSSFSKKVEEKDLGTLHVKATEYANEQLKGYVDNDYTFHSSKLNYIKLCIKLHPNHDDLIEVATEYANNELK